MYQINVHRRKLLQLVVGAGAGIGATSENSRALSTELEESSRPTDSYTKATFKAAIDAIIPATPELASEIGSEHESGGIKIGLDEFLITYLNDLFDASIPRTASTDSDLTLSELIVVALDGGATELLASGENEDQPDPEQFPKGGPFAKLSRQDRFRAMAVAESEGDGQAATLIQALIGFGAQIYYSEWDGYDDFTQPPDEREFTGEVQSWKQTDYSGPADGYAVLRGYKVNNGEESR